jgi:uracil-DNA glycosylase
MGFCFPGAGSSGDLPPRPECAPTWRRRVLDQLGDVQLTLVIGQYAQRYHLPHDGRSVTDTVRSWRDYWPLVVPLPHPSPRNNSWLKKNEWFEEELVPEVRQRVATILSKATPG